MLFGRDCQVVALSKKCQAMMITIIQMIGLFSLVYHVIVSVYLVSWMIQDLRLQPLEGVFVGVMDTTLISKDPFILVTLQVMD